jgi:hypothetical protein
MASTVDAAILALTSLLQAAPALSGVSVFDGPPTEETAEWIAVGYTPGDVVAADASYEWENLRGSVLTETFDILGTLNSLSGDGTIASRRARAGAMRDAIGAVVQAHITLSNTVESARLSAATLMQESTTKGPTAGYLFRITCTAQIQS